MTMKSITIRGKRGRVLYVSLEEFDRDMLVAEAKSIGTTLSDYIRMRVQDSRDQSTIVELKDKFKEAKDK